MEETRAEKNRVIAEWLGWTGFRVFDSDGQQFKEHGVLWAHPPNSRHDGELAVVPDFYTSEEASALALEKLGIDAYIQLSFSEINKWKVSWSNGVDRSHLQQFTDRKTVIAEAAYLCAVERKATV